MLNRGALLKTEEPLRQQTSFQGKCFQCPSDGSLVGSSPSRLGCFHATAATVSSDAANSLQSAVDVVPVQKLRAER